MEQPSPSRSNPAAVVGLVTGIAAVITVLWFSIVIGGALTLVAILAGNFGIQEAKKGKGGREMAIAGMALGLISVVLQVIYNINN